MRSEELRRARYWQKFGGGTDGSNDKSISWRWRRLIGVRFLFDILHVTYPRRSDSVQEGVADGTILPVDQIGTIEGDLNRPGSTKKPGKWLPSRMCRLFHGTCSIHLQTSGAVG